MLDLNTVRFSEARTAGLSLVAFSIAKVCSEDGGWVQISDLREKLGLDRARCSKAIRHIKESQSFLLEERADSGDKRKKLIKVISIQEAEERP